VLSSAQQPWIIEASVCCVWDAAGPVSSNGVVLRALVAAKASVRAPFLWLPPVNFLRKSTDQSNVASVKFFLRQLQTTVISISDPPEMASAGFIESSFNRHPASDGVSLATGSSAVIFQFDPVMQKYVALQSFSCTALVLSASSKIDGFSLSASTQVVSTVCEQANPIFAQQPSDVAYGAVAVPLSASLFFYTTSTALSNLRFFVLSQPRSVVLQPGLVQVGDACSSNSPVAASAAFIACLRVAVTWTPTIEDVGDSALSILTYATDVFTGNVVIGDVASVILHVAPAPTPSITFDESSSLNIPVRLNELISVDLRSSNFGVITPTKPLPTNAALVPAKSSLSVFLFRPLPFQGSLLQEFCFQQSHSNTTVTSCLHVQLDAAPSEVSLSPSAADHCAAVHLARC
jgi:hypothetical protein